MCIIKWCKKKTNKHTTYLYLGCPFNIYVNSFSQFTEEEDLLEEEEQRDTSSHNQSEQDDLCEEQDVSFEEEKSPHDTEPEETSSGVKSSPFQVEPLEFEGLGSATLSAEEDKVGKSRRLSATSDDLLYEDSLAETRNVPSVSAADDQDMLLELNTEDQEQFEVLDIAEAEEEGAEERLDSTEGNGE